MVNGFCAMVALITPSLIRLKRVRIDIHGDEQTIRSVFTLKHLADFLAGGSFQTDEGVDLRRTGQGEILLRLVKSIHGLAFDVEHVNDLDPRVSFKDVLIALQALIQIGLAGHAEEDDIALSSEFVYHAMAAETTGLKIIGSDEVKAMAVGSVRVDGDDRDSWSIAESISGCSRAASDTETRMPIG